MKLNEIIPKKFTDAAKKTGKVAFEKAAAAFNAADDWGGEARDYIVAKIDKNPAIKSKMQSVMDKFRKEDAIKDRLDAVEQGRRESRMANEADKAPPPTAEELARAEAQVGLGDPSIKAQIYGRTSCPWTGRSITLLEKEKVDYDYIDMDDSDHEPLQSKLIDETKQNTVPYIYLRGEFLGGFNALDEITRLGQLSERIKPKSERKAKVEVAPRENTDEVAPGETTSLN